jgi:hypothetical protein
MSTWVGMGPVIGPGSLDGFAIGVMMSGVCFLAVMAPRRARRRQAVAAGTASMLTGGPREWLSRRPRVPRISRAPRVSGIPQVSAVSGIPEVSGARAFDAGVLEPGAFEAGAFGPGPFEPGSFGPGTFEAGAERLARPGEPGALNDAECAPSVGDDGRAARGHRSRDRLNESLPGKMSDRTPRGGTSRDGGPRGGVALGGAPRCSGGFPDSAFPECAFPDSASPDSGFPAVSIPDEARRDTGRLEPLPSYMALRDAGWLESGDTGRPKPRDDGRLEPRDTGRLNPRDGGRLEPPFPDWASRDEAPFPKTASRDRGRPDVEFPDIAFPDGTFGTSKRPESRRLPRHAAPTVGLGSKVSHRLTGLFARPAASDARGG